MRLITNLIKNLNTFKDNTPMYLEAATLEAADIIIDMNIGQLYDSGENREGKKITPEYTPKTVKIKKAKGQPTNRVTLRDTFDWQCSFWLQYYDYGFEIKASDWKTEQLTQKYGEEILGLQDNKLPYLIANYYKPMLLKHLRKAASK